MKKIAKLVSHLFEMKTQTKLTMAPTRYFPNNQFDFDSGSHTSIQVSNEHLLNEIDYMIQNIITHFKPVQRHGEDGLYLGTAGVSYMYYHLSKQPVFEKQRHNFLLAAIEFITPSLSVAEKYVNMKKDVPAFLLGNCGIYAVASVVYNAINNMEKSAFYRNLYYNAAKTCKDQRFLDCGSDEFFVGRAGYLCGALWMAKETNTNPKLEILHDICHVIITSGREYAFRHRSPCPLMYSYYGTEYFGAAHGLCSILQMLITVPQYLDTHPSDVKDVKSSVDYLLNLQDDEGNFPSATDEIGYKHELIHWCHGAPGVVYLMGKAWLFWKEEKYLKACEKMAELVWQKGLLRKGPGICHGIAGNGYVFLLLYRLTNDEKYLHRAIMFAQFIETSQFKDNANIPDNPYSLFEGNAGTVCFLADLISPSQAVFPFFDIF